MDAKVTAAGSVGVVRAAAVAIVAVVTGLYVAVRRLLPTVPEWVRVLREADDSTSMDPSTGAVRSVQSAEVVLPADRIDALWAPVYLERLARTYWDFLTRATSASSASTTPTASGSSACWSRGQAADVRRAGVRDGRLARRRALAHREAACSSPAAGARATATSRSTSSARPARRARAGSIVHVEVEVANFFPAIASTIGRWFYTHTQSRIHVLVTQGFLRSLARLDLAPSQVGAPGDASRRSPTRATRCRSTAPERASGAQP